MCFTGASQITESPNPQTSLRLYLPPFPQHALKVSGLPLKPALHKLIAKLWQKPCITIYCSSKEKQNQSTTYHIVLVFQINV